MIALATVADAGPLPEGDPEDQHEAAGDDRPRADLDVRVACEALVEHVPRLQAVPAEHEQRRAHAVEHEPGEELQQPARKPVARGQVDDGGERRHARTVGARPRHFGRVR